MRIQAEIVNGKCPTCEEYTMLVGLTKQFYRCMTCGADLEQHVNGCYKLHSTHTQRDTKIKSRRVF